MVIWRPQIFFTRFPAKAISPTLCFCHLLFFFARKCQTLHLGLLSWILLFLTQHSNLSGSLWVLILSPLVLTLPPRFVTSTPLISMPPEFSSSDKSDMIKDGALRTQQKHSLKVDTHSHELETALLRSEEMEHGAGLSTHPPRGLPDSPSTSSAASAFLFLPPETCLFVCFHLSRSSWWPFTCLLPSCIHWILPALLEASEQQA